MIQSFLPGEVTYKEAHQIGVELADRLLEGKYSNVVSTHIDKGHVHNHVIFCAADNTKAHKFISFRPLDRERFIRGSAKSLGAEYTKERIKERIEEKALAKDKKRVPFPTRKKPIVRDYSKKNLIDTTEDKFTESPGLKHWADIQNLKIAAAAYSQSGSISELEEQIAAKSELAKTARTSLVETERQLKDLGQILKYAEQYKTNRIYHIRYQKSKDNDRYLRQHETELLLHDGAENMLKRFGIDTRNLDAEKLRSDYNVLYSKKHTLQNTYKTAEKELAGLNRKLDNLNQYLDWTPAPQATGDKKHDKSQNSL